MNKEMWIVDMTSHHRQYKILIIDDDPLNLKFLTNRLSLEGYDTISAVNGEEGLQKSLREKPDLILLDIIMPGMSGFDVCDQLKALPETRSIPVLFITSLSSPEDRKRGLEVGAVGYITKPLDMKTLKNSVRNHLPDSSFL
jgi:putative two-component system response regulator